MSGLNQIRHTRQNILHHLRRDIDARGRDAIAEFHRVIDLVDGISAIGFKQIERQQPVAHRLRRGHFYFGLSGFSLGFTFYKNDHAQNKNHFMKQYLRQLWSSGRLKNRVNSAQASDLLENLSQ